MVTLAVSGITGVLSSWGATPSRYEKSIGIIYAV
jgi:hypothetical protein